jgi:hypothetical protein
MKWRRATIFKYPKHRKKYIIIIIIIIIINPLNAELNPICHLLALLGAHPIIHVSRIRVKRFF